jgi:hypothetical protein
VSIFDPVDHTFCGHPCGIITKNLDLFDVALRHAAKTAILESDSQLESTSTANRPLLSGV